MHKISRYAPLINEYVENVSFVRKDMVRYCRISLFSILITADSFLISGMPMNDKNQSTYWMFLNMEMNNMEGICMLDANKTRSR